MAWMTYISSWFEQDDWYEGLQRVSDIYVVIIILCFFISHAIVLYYCVIFMVDNFALQKFESSKVLI